MYVEPKIWIKIDTQIKTQKKINICREKQTETVTHRWRITDRETQIVTQKQINTYRETQTERHSK